MGRVNPMSPWVVIAPVVWVLVAVGSWMFFGVKDALGRRRDGTRYVSFRELAGYDGGSLSWIDRLFDWCYRFGDRLVRRLP
jgi:hypothetical protein